MTHRTLILTGGEIPYHKYPDAMSVLSDALKNAGFDVTATHDPASVGALNGYASVVLFTDNDFFTDAQIDSLVSFVRSGKGLISIHTGAGTNKGSATFGRMIGSRIVSGAIVEHTVNIIDANHPITQGMKDFRIDDEIHQLDPIDQFRVLATADMNGKDEPIVYVKSEGAGKVVHFATGHTPAGLSHPEWQKMFVRAANFVSA